MEILYTTKKIDKAYKERFFLGNSQLSTDYCNCK